MDDYLTILDPNPCVELRGVWVRDLYIGIRCATDDMALRPNSEPLGVGVPCQYHKLGREALSASARVRTDVTADRSGDLPQEQEHQGKEEKFDDVEEQGRHVRRSAGT